MTSFEVPVYAKRGLTVVRGKGALVWDDAGQVYVDCIGGHGVAVVGHSHPRVVAAICRQAERLIICPNTLDNDVRRAYLERLVSVTPPGLDYVFLANSGAEAVEAAIKFARVATGRTRLVAMTRSFHGRTMGALSLTGNRKYRDPFTPLVPDVVHVPFGDLEAAREAVDERTAAVVVEPVQGEGGVHPAPDGYLATLRALCDRAGALLVVDEVQTGFGRTGAWFAVEHWQVIPDVLCLAKGIAGGVPMGATVVTERVARALKPGHHGSTFGGNPLACAAGLAVLDILAEEDLVAQARAKGEYLLAGLRALTSSQVRAVRGLGLMVGLELRTRATPYLRRLQEDYRVLALPAGPNVIRLLPPLVITYEQLDTVIQALQEVLET